MTPCEIADYTPMVTVSVSIGLLVGLWLASMLPATDERAGVLEEARWTDENLADEALAIERAKKRGKHGLND